MKKKTLSLVLIASLSISLLAGCGKKDESSNDVVTETPTVEATVEPIATQEPEATTEAEPTQEAQEAYSTEAVEAAGSIDGVTYTNTNIGFSLSVPESWLIYDADDTYSYILKAQGGTDEDIATLKEQLKAQGITYICYGSDTQLGENGGADNLLVQSMNAELFGGLAIEDVIKSLSSVVVNQYSSMGATCTVTDPTKVTIDGQDVYQVSAVATMSITGEDETTTEQTVKQEYIIFQKNGTLVYMALSTALEDSTTLAQTVIDTLSFQ